MYFSFTSSILELNSCQGYQICVKVMLLLFFLSDFVTAPTFICGIKYLLSANILPSEQNMSSEEGGNFLILQEITATFSWKYIVSVGTRF